jgi:cell division protein ZapA
VTGKKSIVRVTIVGEEYSIKSDASPEHTRRVAEYVDQAIRTVMRGSAVEPQKAAILAALQITNELFEANEAAAALSGDLESLSAEVRRWLPPAKRA